MKTPRGWMTLEQVQEYLGHNRRESTEVWLTRHSIKSQRFFPAAEVKREREPHTAGTNTKVE